MAYKNLSERLRLKPSRKSNVYLGFVYCWIM